MTVNLDKYVFRTLKVKMYIFFILLGHQLFYVSEHIQYIDYVFGHDDLYRVSFWTAENFIIFRYPNAYTRVVTALHVFYRLLDMYNSFLKMAS